jgi:hypothetical protein
MTAHHHAGNHEIETASGLYLDITAPDPAAISLEDIAHALAHTCRFGGHCRRFYSVAEHALIVSRRLAHQGHDVDVQLIGLHHDDAEAYIGDIPRPIKPLLRDFAELENRVEAAIRQALDLPAPPYADRAIKDADMWALALEAHILLPSRGRGWICDGLYKHHPGPALAIGLDPHSARTRWLRRHDELVAQAERQAA